MKNTDIRSAFINYFKSKNHTYVKSCPIAPENDPSLLFINAGMNQFKDVFLGTGTRDYSRATNSQICLRVSGKHNDLEDVGHDVSHLTLFEMLGNWSFGDYYKKEAITWAWDLLTNVFKLDKSKLYATVYTTDDESDALWKSETDIAKDHVLRFGDKDNFWEMGKTGPCGPCSEIHMDRGPDHCHNTDPNHTCFVNGDCERYLEIWNLVFIQYNREEDGSLTDLPHKHVDTGAGFERLCAILQNVPSVYDTDAFKPIIQKIEDISGITYHADERGTPHRVMADHIRPLVFGISDNVYPSNEGRGYVLRRLLRRALRYANNIGIKEPVLHKLVPTLLATMDGFFESIEQRQETMTKIIKSEEISFLKTLDAGLELLQGHIKTLNLPEGKTADGKSTAILSGETAFKLYDTYGFPLDLTKDFCKEHHLSVDDVEFERLLNEQKHRSRQAQQFSDMKSKTDARAKDAASHSQQAQSASKSRQAHAAPDSHSSSNESFESALDSNKEPIILDDTLHHAPDQQVAKGGEARILTNSEDKRDMARHHTGTHLLHEALRTTLGDHVFQAGSLVDTHRLRFDFSHFEGLSKEQLADIEAQVNKKIKEALPVTIKNMGLDEAKQKGAMALFGEKYGDDVRTVKIGDYSFELCGGTHVKNTKDIESFKIIGESAISSGTRRIEALAGKKVIEAYLQDVASKKRSQLTAKINQLKTQAKTLESQGQSNQDINNVLTEASQIKNLNIQALHGFEKHLLSALKLADKLILKHQQQSLSDNVEEFENAISSLSNGNHLLVIQKPDVDMKTAKTFSDKLMTIKPSLIAIILCSGGSQLLVRCDKSVLEQTTAPAILNAITDITGGRGGGRPDMAQAGGIDGKKFEQGISQMTESLNLTR